jgi:hypothetical protein
MLPPIPSAFFVHFVEKSEFYRKKHWVFEFTKCTQAYVHFVHFVQDGGFPKMTANQLGIVIDEILPVIPSDIGRLVLISCVRRAGQNGEFKADAARTAERLGVSLRRVQRAFDTMLKVGLIEVARENPKTYRLNLKAFRCAQRQT